MEHTTEAFGPIIYSYSRAQAIADGTLVDVSAMAEEAGFQVPVALTHAAWADCVAWSDADDRRQICQDEAGRLWDVLWLAGLAARRARGVHVTFQIYRVPRGGRATRPRLTSLQLQIGPGDVGEPVVTIMKPDEN